MNILQQIARYKALQVVTAKQTMPLAEIKKSPLLHRTAVSAVGSIRQHRGYAVITEFKRKSPSRGNIRLSARVEDVVPGYVQAGAAAISVLTDTLYFGGAAADLQRAREVAPRTPLLRKDFIVDIYQIYESKMLGADLILLIAALLTREQIREFTVTAHALGLEVLLELYGTADFEKTDPAADLIGINNRDLTTFQVDTGRALSLLEKLPADRLLVSESGIADEETGRAQLQQGFDALLAGEMFMKAPRPADRARAFIQYLKNAHYVA